jgi:hypothetical protein
MNYDKLIYVWITDSNSREFAKEYLRLNGYNVVDYRNIEHYDSLVDADIVEVESDVDNHVEILSGLEYVSGAEKYDHNYTVICHELKDMKHDIDNVEDFYGSMSTTKEDFNIKLSEFKKNFDERIERLKSLK